MDDEKYNKLVELIVNSNHQCSKEVDIAVIKATTSYHKAFIEDIKTEIKAHGDFLKMILGGMKLIKFVGATLIVSFVCQAYFTIQHQHPKHSTE